MTLGLRVLSRQRLSKRGDDDCRCDECETAEAIYGATREKRRGKLKTAPLSWAVQERDRHIPESENRPLWLPGQTRFAS